MSEDLSFVQYAEFDFSGEPAASLTLEATVFHDESILGKSRLRMVRVVSLYGNYVVELTLIGAPSLIEELRNRDIQGFVDWLKPVGKR